MRKTKIICTIGPASESKEVLTKMCEAGMNVARLNFSHGTHEEHQKKIDTIKEVRESLNMPIAIMLDTKGPEYRIKTFKDEKVTLETGKQFIFTVDDVEGDETRVSVSYKNLVNELKIGTDIMARISIATKTSTKEKPLLFSFLPLLLISASMTEIESLLYPVYNPI